MARSFSGAQPFTLRRPVSHVGGHQAQTAAGTVTLTYASGQYQKIDPDGSHRDVALPSARRGAFFDVVNSAGGAENLVVKDGASTVVTLNQSEGARVYVAEGASTWSLGHVFTANIS